MMSSGFMPKAAFSEASYPPVADVVVVPHELCASRARAGCAWSGLGSVKAILVPCSAAVVRVTFCDAGSYDFQKAAPRPPAPARHRNQLHRSGASWSQPCRIGKFRRQIRRHDHALLAANPIGADNQSPAGLVRLWRLPAAPTSMSSDVGQAHRTGLGKSSTRPSMTVKRYTSVRSRTAASRVPPCQLPEQKTSLAARGQVSVLFSSAVFAAKARSYHPGPPFRSPPSR